MNCHVDIHSNEHGNTVIDVSPNIFQIYFKAIYHPRILLNEVVWNTCNKFKAYKRCDCNVVQYSTSVKTLPSYSTGTETWRRYKFTSLFE